MNSNILIVLTGKTAAGKDTVQSVLLSRLPNLRRIITTTSRKIRIDEKNGVDYHFVTRKEFEEKIKNNDFLEYVEYGGNLYGTEKKELLEKLAEFDVIWRIDPSAAANIRAIINSLPQLNELAQKTAVIFLTVSNEVILERLKKRGLSEEEIKKRMDDDEMIWQKNKDKYDYILENIPGKLDQTVEKALNIIDAKKDN